MDATSSTTVALPELIQAGVAVVAPTTVVAALLLYFGYNRTAHLFLTFGVDVSSLALSAQDYTLRSVEAIFAPIILLLIVFVAGLWAHQSLLSQRRRGSRRWHAWLIASLYVVGGALLARGLLGIAVPSVSRNELVMTPFALSVGMGLLAYGHWLRRSAGHEAAGQPAWLRYLSTGIVVAIMLLSMFWATTNYAQAYGRAVAAEFINGDQLRPAVTVYSDVRLYLDQAAVTEQELENGGLYRYRYDGLRLLTESSGRFFLFAQPEEGGDVVTYVIRDDERLRISLHPR